MLGVLGLLLQPGGCGARVLGLGAAATGGCGGCWAAAAAWGLLAAAKGLLAAASQAARALVPPAGARTCRAASATPHPAPRCHPAAPTACCPCPCPAPQPPQATSSWSPARWCAAWRLPLCASAPSSCRCPGALRTMGWCRWLQTTSSSTTCPSCRVSAPGMAAVAAPPGAGSPPPELAGWAAAAGVPWQRLECLRSQPTAAHAGAAPQASPSRTWRCCARCASAPGAWWRAGRRWDLCTACSTPTT
jgi:hypothetical protein